MNPEIFENKLGNCRILTAKDADEVLFTGYCKRLKQNGFEVRETRPGFASFRNGDVGCFVNYFPTTEEVRVVTETDCRYFDYLDHVGRSVVAPQISQIHLEDFGMSYAVRLSDGRFIVIDGGNSYDSDAKRLYDCLKAGSPHETPVIAAWIMTHAHSDHFHCFLKFFPAYKDEVKIEKMLFYFPDADDTVHYPKMTADDPRREEDISNTVTIPRFLALVKESGARVFTPHTGQNYKIGDAFCEILSSPDDTVHCSTSLNASSLVIRMTLGGQVILWGADAVFSAARLAERYGKTLKADILQVPHHGFSSGTEEALIAGYNLIDPKVCLLPASDFVAYDFFSAFKEGTHHLLTNLQVEEVITGEKTRTITLPYTPAPEAKRWRERFAAGQASAGARSWVFSGLNTANQGDMTFTVVNFTARTPALTAEIYFEAPNPTVRHIEIPLGLCEMKRVTISDPKQVRSEEVFFNPNSLLSVGIPKNTPFTVRFLCNTPVVIAHDRVAAAYYGG